MAGAVIGPELVLKKNFVKYMNGLEKKTHTAEQMRTLSIVQ